MKRLQLIEIGDQCWLPTNIRDALTDYLQFVIHLMQSYLPIAVPLCHALKVTADRQVVDLCSGGAGPWLSLLPVVQESTSIRVLLTDKFPNLQAFQRASLLSQKGLAYVDNSIDATNVPAEFGGFRTLFSAFHHFPPPQARAILLDAINKRQGIGIFEGTQRSAFAVFLMLLAPFMVFVFTPFIRPFRWTRLCWTYAVPIIPLIVMFDGIISCLRTYTPIELRALIAGLPSEIQYHWEVGEQQMGRAPLPVTYLIGYPVAERVVRP